MTYFLVMLVAVFAYVVGKATVRKKKFGKEELRSAAAQLGGIDKATAKTIRIVTVVTGMPFTAPAELAAQTAELNEQADELRKQAINLRAQAYRLDDEAKAAENNASVNDILLAPFTD